jgi:rhamnulose-1-phosphate aldolase
MTEIFEQFPGIGEHVKQLAEIVRLLWEKGWAERNAGNISVNITSLIGHDKIRDSREELQFGLEESYTELAGNCYLITVSGSRMRNLAVSPNENLVIIQITDDGASYNLIPMASDADSKALHPTSELSTHLGIQQLIARRGSKEKVIIHTHATELIALTQNPEFRSAEAINKLLWGMHPETIIFIPKGIGFVPYCLPGSKNIAELTIQNLKYHDIVVWEKHGVFAIGETIADTFDNIDILCKSAGIYFMCRGAGFVPEGLTPTQLGELKELVKKFSSA